MKVLVVSEVPEHKLEIERAFQRGEVKASFVEAKVGIEAIKAAKRYEPDFLFLDVHVSDESGLEIAELLHQLNLQANIILMGNKVDYAIEAFRLRAFYYLLQPFHDDDLEYLVYLMRKEHLRWCRALSHKLPIEEQDGIAYISPQNIIYVSKNKENKTVSIYTKDGHFTSTYTLQELEEKLHVHQFLRVHKSYLVNLPYIKALKPYYNGTYNLYTEYCSEPIPVSRNYVRMLRNKLEI
ncbi:LytTR family DNA-binding domain-containing protein [Ectobacillus antri]|jgi:DNA-binding LytR/AlgR family response regulator|uniref:LytTR family DNA-binding domain-containing protein n=1 Tax=Ectobacillus antri TaxID=2486280 RepID=A0ABT6H7S3_9BACI|nr:LytTR family DNA-binding domain-containing protein [Ectobacillus antri]MDG4657708.1 LytTR family DNA-binding domain-containing protein [Ectobacillus antri]MDG5754715.1 LytTR family DNA-binding domain-containing protein [Ectobacillus antri]